MGRKKKPFIDKKHSTTYKLVHRSQHDPLVADQDASQMVLAEIPGVGDEPSSAPRVSASARRKTQQEFGIYYEDDYDYMQHVKEREEGGTVWEAVNPTRPGQVVLPTCVLPSATEEPVGMLNLAAPRGLDLSLDPDIVAALDDDFDFENPELELEDDFIGMAEGAILEEYGAEEGAGHSGGYIGSDNEQYGSEDEDDVNSLFSGGAVSDDQSCRFTEYSVSSSVLPRNEGLTMLDNRFEEMYKEYDVLGAGEEDLPAVDELGVETEPTMVLEQLCDEFERQDLDDEETLTITKAKTLALAQEHAERPEKKEKVVEEMDHRIAIQWDCETILSTYSNIYNHPKVIEIPLKIKLDKRGIAINEVPEDKDMIDEEEEDGYVSQSDEEEEKVVISNYRTKSETAEEKKARKAAVKEGQRMRRQIKKATKEVFKEESTREGKFAASKVKGRVIKL